MQTNPINNNTFFRMITNLHPEYTMEYLKDLSFHDFQDNEFKQPTTPIKDVDLLDKVIDAITFAIGNPDLQDFFLLFYINSKKNTIEIAPCPSNTDDPLLLNMGEFNFTDLTIQLSLYID